MPALVSNGSSHNKLTETSRHKANVVEAVFGGVNTGPSADKARDNWRADLGVISQGSQFIWT